MRTTFGYRNTVLSRPNTGNSGENTTAGCYSRYNQRQQNRLTTLSKVIGHGPWEHYRQRFKVGQIRASDPNFAPLQI